MTNQYTHSLRQDMNNEWIADLYKNNEKVSFSFPVRTALEAKIIGDMWIEEQCNNDKKVTTP